MRTFLISPYTNKAIIIREKIPDINAGSKHEKVAIGSAGFSRMGRSNYCIKRICRRKAIKLSAKLIIT